MSNNIDDIQKQLEEFSSNFLELSKLQKLLLNYISSIKEQKDEIVALYEKNFNETKDLSNIIELLFEENLIKESKKIEDEIEKEYQKLEKILIEYSKVNDLTKQIQDLDYVNYRYKQYLYDSAEKVEEIKNKINDILSNNNMENLIEKVEEIKNKINDILNNNNKENLIGKVEEIKNEINIFTLQFIEKTNILKEQFDGIQNSLSKNLENNYNVIKKFFRKSIVFNLFMFIIFSLIILAYMYFYK